MKFKSKIEHLPTVPGCYIMKNKEGIVIYVGKAKNIKSRVKSYFTGVHNIKTTRLVSEINDFSFVVTNSEQESLILELNLIKQYQPKYNILLTDDKTYPFIELIKDKDTYKIEVVRKKHLTGKLFGPYPNTYSARMTADLLTKMFPMGNVNKIPNFLEQLGNDLVGSDDNNKKAFYIVTRFLKGDDKIVINALVEAMNKASENLEYEKALNYKNYLDHIKATTEKQLISLNDYKNRDIIGFAYDKENVSLNILFMRRGRIVDNFQQIFEYVGSPIDQMLQVLQSYYEGEYPDEMLFSNNIDEQLLKDNFLNHYFIPKIGDKKKLVDLANKNAKHDLKHYFLVYKNKVQTHFEALKELEEILNINNIYRIETFDNAHLFGSSLISAMIVYENGNLLKKDYRKYHLKTAKIDDYQSFKEVLYRRYQRLLLEKKDMPSLILVDGGKGQVSASIEILRDLNLNIKVAGLKKDSKHKLTSLIYDNKEYVLKRNSKLYKFLGFLSEEVHRFAQSFFKTTHQRKMYASPLDNIKGVGVKTKKLLLDNFQTLENILKATDEELRNVGISKNVIKEIRNLK